ncbi:MAG: replication-associated recombination protein A [Bacillota bacterium]
MSQKGLWGEAVGPEMAWNGKPRPTTANDRLGMKGPVDSGLLVIPPDAPLALRMTPRSFDEFLGQEELVGPGKALRQAIEGDRIPSMLFWGPPGIGKTALARLIAMQTHSVFRELSAVTSGVQDVRDVVAEAARLRREGKRTILFLDEIHRFNKAQQDALLPHVERGTIVLIGATTENPYFSVNPALLSRMRIFTFSHLREEHIETLVKRAIEDKERGLLAGKRSTSGRADSPTASGAISNAAQAPPTGEGPANKQVLSIEIEPKALEHIVGFSKGDARTALNVLEALYNVGEIRGDKVVLLADRALEITQSPQLFYDKTGDQHYDVISAFIKSMRGSDPDATVYWLARMLEAGEDPRFVARRIVICASEDVGLADSNALLVAEAAHRAAEHIGMPEARIPLVHAALYVALAPKSNSACGAIDRAIAAVREKPAYAVPPHLRGTGYKGAEKLGHGVDYKYAHNYPGHWVEQQYLPKELIGEQFFTRGEKDPGNRGRGEK